MASLQTARCRGKGRQIEQMAADESWRGPHWRPIEQGYSAAMSAWEKGEQGQQALGLLEVASLEDALADMDEAIRRAVVSLEQLPVLVHCQGLDCAASHDEASLPAMNLQRGGESDTASETEAAI